MIEVLNYPIKYAVLEIKDQDGKISGYIVEKVYVIGENTKYFKDGTSKKIYQIVYPFKNKADYELGGITPKFTEISECNNCDYTEQLFNSYEEAKDISRHLNKKLRENYLTSIDTKLSNWPEKVIARQRRFDEKLAIYEDFELAVAFLELKMMVSEEPVLLTSSLSR